MWTFTVFLRLPVYANLNSTLETNLQGKVITDRQTAYYREGGLAGDVIRSKDLDARVYISVLLN